MADVMNILPPQTAVPLLTNSSSSQSVGWSISQSLKVVNFANSVTRKIASRSHETSSSSMPNKIANRIYKVSGYWFNHFYGPCGSPKATKYKVRMASYVWLEMLLEPVWEQSASQSRKQSSEHQRRSQHELWWIYLRVAAIVWIALLVKAWICILKVAGSGLTAGFSGTGL